MFGVSGVDSLAEVSATGDNRKLLEGLRDRLAADIDACNDPALVGPLAGQLRRVVEALGVGEAESKGGSPLDELTRRRRAKSAG